jgi:osmotically-inducible protein OsmY
MLVLTAAQAASMKGSSMNNADLARDVLDELLWDDSIGSSRINVTTDDGRVVISGSVNTFYDKWAAGQAAWRVYGVRDVQNDLIVDLGAERVLDVDLTTAANAGLDANSRIPKGAVTISVQDAWVTMSGNLQHYFQHQAAEHVIRHLHGMRGYSDLLTVSKEPAHKVSAKIGQSLKRNAAVDADNIKVSDSGGVVTLTGTVRSKAEAQEAEHAAWLAPGVTAVYDQLVVVG